MRGKYSGNFPRTKLYEIPEGLVSPALREILGSSPRKTAVFCPPRTSLREIPEGLLPHEILEGLRPRKTIDQARGKQIPFTLQTLASPSISKCTSMPLGKIPAAISGHSIRQRLPSRASSKPSSYRSLCDFNLYKS